MFFNFALKTAGNYNTHFIDTHGYIEYNLVNLGFEFTDQLEFFPQQVPIHQCTPEDFDSHNFDSYEPAMQSNLLSMMCYDRLYPINVYGNLDTQSGQVISVDLVKCTLHDYCKNDQEIDEFLKDKAFQFGQNYVTYDQENYERIPVQSKLDFTQI